MPVTIIRAWKPAHLSTSHIPPKPAHALPLPIKGMGDLVGPTSPSSDSINSPIVGFPPLKPPSNDVDPPEPVVMPADSPRPPSQGGRGEPIRHDHLDESPSDDLDPPSSRPVRIRLIDDDIRYGDESRARRNEAERDHDWRDRAERDWAERERVERDHAGREPTERELEGFRRQQEYRRATEEHERFQSNDAPWAADPRELEGLRRRQEYRRAAEEHERLQSNDDPWAADPRELEGLRRQQEYRRAAEEHERLQSNDDLEATEWHEPRSREAGQQSSRNTEPANIEPVLPAKKNTKFKKGESGNPKGRPRSGLKPPSKKSDNMESPLFKKYTVTDKKTGKKKRLFGFQILELEAWKQANSGNFAALKFLLTYSMKDKDIRELRKQFLLDQILKES